MQSINLVLYDGSCGFCNFWVKWILKNDRHQQFMFASLQSEIGQSFLINHGYSPTNFDTLYLVQESGYYYHKLDAIIKIASLIGGFYRMAEWLNVLPQWVRDMMYMLIAKNRKRIMGESCYLPSPTERKLFLE